MSITRSLRFRLFVSFLLVLAPLVAMMFHINLQGMNVARKQTAQSNQNTLALYTEQIDRNLAEAEDYLFNIMANDPHLLTLTLLPSDHVDYILAKGNLQKKIRSDMVFLTNVQSMFMYNLASNDFLLISKQNVESAVAEEQREIARTWNFSDRDRNWALLETKEGMMLYKLNQVNAELVLGMTVPVSSVTVPLDLLDLGPRGGTVILNGDGYPITGNGLAPEQTETLQALVAGGRKGSFTLPGSGGSRDERFLAVVEPFRRANLSLAAVMPESQFLKPLKELQLALTFIPLAVVLVLAIYVLLMQQSLMKPINRLVRGMRHIQEGIFTARVPETRIGELDYLMQSFNAMATQIQQLKIGIYEEQLRTQQAELKHLQAQINPHFYMNTLNIIYNYAALKEYESIQELALLLSEYCRFAMRTGQAEIPLETEFHHIANYLNIQKIRFESRLTYEVALPDACKPLLILPLTVQPLVENAIVHGFKGKRKLHVTLSCALRLEDGREFLEVLVSDNGEGFSEQSLLRLGEKSGPTASGEHLGIWNVTRRLGMRYGGEMSVHFANKPDGGAVVALRLPIYNYASEEDKPNDYDAGSR